MTSLGILVGYDGEQIVNTLNINSGGNAIQRALDTGPIFDRCVIFALTPISARIIARQAERAHLTYPNGHVEPWPVVAQIVSVQENHHGSNLHTRNEPQLPTAQDARSQVQATCP